MVSLSFSFFTTWPPFTKQVGMGKKLPVLPTSFLFRILSCHFSVQWGGKGKKLAWEKIGNWYYETNMTEPKGSAWDCFNRWPVSYTIRLLVMEQQVVYRGQLVAIHEKGKTSSCLYTNEWRPLPKYVVVHTKKFKKSKWKGIYRNQ